MAISREQTDRETEELLQAELETLKEQTDGREQLFLDLAKQRYGLQLSEGRQYLVTVNEFSLYFPATVKHPFYKEQDIV